VTGIQIKSKGKVVADLTRHRAYGNSHAYLIQIYSGIIIIIVFPCLKYGIHQQTGARSWTSNIHTLGSFRCRVFITGGSIWLYLAGWDHFLRYKLVFDRVVDTQVGSNPGQGRAEPARVSLWVGLSLASDILIYQNCGLDHIVTYYGPRAGS
jgi:hypothetical protein